MKHLIVLPLVLFVVSCGSIVKEEPKPVPVTESVADIIEENKEDLNYIKDRTADDLELGHAVREMVVEGKLSNTAIGFEARKITLSQKTTPEQIKQDNGATNKRISSVAKLCLCVLVGMGICSLIHCIVRFIRRKKNE